MPMNKQRQQEPHRRNLIRLVLLALVFLPTLTASAQQEPPPVVVEETQTTSSQTEVEAEIEATRTPGAAQQSAPASTAAEKTVNGFKPSEQIGADSAVSFPVDI